MAKIRKNEPPEIIIKVRKTTTFNGKVAVFYGASDLTRTGDLLITSEMHYRLCYTSVVSLNIISAEEGKVNIFLKNPPAVAVCLCCSANQNPVIHRGEGICPFCMFRQRAAKCAIGFPGRNCEIVIWRNHLPRHCRGGYYPPARCKIPIMYLVGRIHTGTGRFTMQPNTQNPSGGGRLIASPTVKCSPNYNF